MSEVETQHNEYVPTTLGYALIYLIMIVGMGSFITGALFGWDGSFAVTMMSAMALVAMASGAMPMKKVGPAVKELEGVDWESVMELEHEFGLPHYDESLTHCPYPMCIPKVWDDVPIGDILATAEMQVDAGLQDSNEIRALRWLQQCEADNKELKERELAEKASTARVQAVQTSLRSMADQKHDKAVREELYNEALEGMRKYGMGFLPAGVEVDTIHNEYGVVRYIFRDTYSRVPYDQMQAIAQASATLIQEQREACETRAKEVAAIDAHIKGLEATSYTAEDASKLLLDYEAVKLNDQQYHDEVAAKRAKRQQQSGMAQLSAMVANGDMSVEEARELGYEQA